MTTARVTLDDSELKPPAGVREAPAGGKNRFRAYIILGAVVALAAVAYLLFRAFAAGRESTDDAQVGSDMVPIAARVGGELIALPVTDNQPVKKGELLAQIDPRDYENKVKQAEADLRAAQAQALAAQAQVGIVEASSRGGLSTARAALLGTAASMAGADAGVAVAQAMLVRAESDAERADGDLRRAQLLRQNGAVPQAQVDSLVSQAAAMHAAVAQAKAQLVAAHEAKNGARTRIAEAAGRVEQSGPIVAQAAVARANADLAAARAAAAEVAVAQAQLNLSYTKITAPRDGHISRLAMHVGQLVQPAQTITNLLPETTYVVANFKETQVGRMRAGQAAEIVVDAWPDRKFHARVQSIAFGTGAQFSMLPPDNASGNFVKVVQRVPVKLVWTDLPSDLPLAAGLSADVTVLVR